MPPKMIKTNKKLIMAAAGTGKTHSLIEELVSVIPNVIATPTKFCVVITYTNLAVAEVKERLVSKYGSIPKNVHISTIHSFLIDFIIDPYAHLLDLTKQDKVYIDSVLEKENKDKSDYFKQKNIAISKANILKTQGVITFDKILEMCNEITGNQRVLEIIQNRISYVFIDEYQDCRLIQHKIIEKIIEPEHINFFAIGDPLQSIYSFSYRSSQISGEKKPDFASTPIMLMKNRSDVCQSELLLNRRCSKNITDLIVLYTGKIGVKISTNKNCNSIPVYFIFGSKDAVFSKYDDLIRSHNLESRSGVNSLILTKRWEDVSFPKINKEKVDGFSNIFSSVEDIISAATGCSKSELINKISGTYFEKISDFRLLCFTMMELLKSGSINNRSDVIDFIRENSPFGSILKQEFNFSIEKLNESLCEKSNVQGHLHSTIHSCKGLQAKNVLVFAEKFSHVTEWLDYENVTGNSDNPRLGYVALSRAEELLCISCTELKSIPKKLKEKLESLNIVIIKAD